MSVIGSAVRHVRRAIRLWRSAQPAWLVLGSACWLACGQSGGARETEPVEFAVQNPRVPLLGCFEAVVSPGDCRRTADCEDEERCVLDTRSLPRGHGPLPLTCAPAPGPLLAREHCERGEDCMSGLCALASICVEPCRRDADCPDGQHCRPVEAHAGEDELGSVMACGRPIALPDDVQLAVVSGQRLRRGINDVAIPAAPDPSLVYIQAECGRGMDVLTLRSNDDDLELYDRTALYAGKKSAINTILHDGSALATLLFPNNPSLTLAERGLTVGVRVQQDESADVVVASRGAGARSLDLNLFYVGGGSATVDGGFRPGDSYVWRMLGQLDDRFRAIGLALGEVRELEIVGELREELSVLEVPRREVNGRQVEGRPQRLEELFRLSAGMDEPGINVFLVSDMGSYLGISGGIPGVLGVHGTSRSGIAIAADTLGDLRDADLVLMHEIAHFMGLFHTTESTGFVLDPLSDTPECRPEYDEDEDRELSTWECEEHGADNLMFWSGSGTVLTPQQIEVLSGSVVLR